MTTRTPTHNRVWNLLVCLLLFFLPDNGYTQGLHNTQKRSPLTTFASNLGSDALYVFSAPLRLTPRGGLQLLTLTAVTTGFVTVLDRRVDEDFIEGDDFYVIPEKKLAEIGKSYDKISPKYVLTAISTSMLAGGLLLRDQKLLETTRLTLESFLIAGAITHVGKWTFGRARPYTGEGPFDFNLFKFSGNRDFRSFPSGHATSAFAMMTVLARQYDRWWVEIPAYTLAVSVAMQRIDSRNHWGADVVVGGAIGYWVGNTLVERNKNQSKDSAFDLHFFGNRIGFTINF